MHIGIIMDGNRRWAKSKGLPKFAGHKYGVENLENLLNLCLKKRINIVTTYALSTENLKREEKELKNLFSLLEKYLKRTKKFKNQGVKINILGNVEVFPESTKKVIKNAIEVTQSCDKLIFNIALNYGGRDEIVRTVKRMIGNKIQINQENLEKNLDTQGLPNPDLIIRTGGDRRLSNFLLWQASYATLYFTQTYWPAFGETEFVKALDFLKTQKQNNGI